MKHPANPNQLSAACPPSGTLARFVLAEPPNPADRTALLDHIAHCPECGAAVRALVSSGADVPDPPGLSSLPSSDPANRGALSQRLSRRSAPLLYLKRWLTGSLPPLRSREN